MNANTTRYRALVRWVERRAARLCEMPPADATLWELQSLLNAGQALRQAAECAELRDRGLRLTVELLPENAVPFRQPRRRV